MNAQELRSDNGEETIARSTKRRSKANRTTLNDTTAPSGRRLNDSELLSDRKEATHSGVRQSDDPKLKSYCPTAIDEVIEGNGPQVNRVKAAYASSEDFVYDEEDVSKGHVYRKIAPKSIAPDTATPESILLESIDLESSPSKRRVPKSTEQEHHSYVCGFFGHTFSSRAFARHMRYACSLRSQT